MKDPSQELLDALYTALNGNVSHASIATPVYTRVKEWEDRTCDQYIHMAEVRYTMDGSPKDGDLSEGTVDIFVDTFYTGKNEGSKEPMNSIANQIGQLIDQGFSLTSFTQVLGRISEMEDFDYELDPQGVVFRKLITYSFIIEQN